MEPILEMTATLASCISETSTDNEPARQNMQKMSPKFFNTRLMRKLIKKSDTYMSIFRATDEVKYLLSTDYMHPLFPRYIESNILPSMTCMAAGFYPRPSHYLSTQPMCVNSKYNLIPPEGSVISASIHIFDPKDYFDYILRHLKAHVKINRHDIDISFTISKTGNATKAKFYRTRSLT